MPRVKFRGQHTEFVFSILSPAQCYTENTLLCYMKQIGSEYAHEYFDALNKEKDTKMENVENLILEHLKVLRAGQDKIVFEVREVKSRLTSLESVTAGGRRDNALQQEEIYRQQATLDHLSERLDRIEKTINLVQS